MLNIFNFKIVFLALIPFVHDLRSPFQCVDYHAITCSAKTSASTAVPTTPGAAPTVVPVARRLDGALMPNRIDQLLSKINEISGELIEKFEQNSTWSEANVTSESAHKLDGAIEVRSNFQPSGQVASDGLFVREKVKESVEVDLQLSSLKGENKNFSKICDPNPCLYGGRCQMVTANDYQCKGCLSLTSGKNCQNINCGYWTCFGWKGTLYVVLEGACGWEEANWKCANEGMTLATPKDRETNVVIVAQLLLVYGAIQHLAFWLGLRREARGWRWVDGRPLGPYTGGYGNFKSNRKDFYGILYLRTRTWVPVPINFQAFPICEKRYCNPSTNNWLF